MSSYRPSSKKAPEREAGTRHRDRDGARGIARTRVAWTDREGSSKARGR